MPNHIPVSPGRPAWLIPVLTPVASAVGGLLSTLIAKLAPVNIPRADFAAIFIAGALLTAAAALHWLSRQPKLVQLSDEARAKLDRVVALVESSQPAHVAIEDIQRLLSDHTADIERAIETKVPGVVGESVAALFKQLIGQQSAQAQAQAQEPRTGPQGVVPPPPPPAV